MNQGLKKNVCWSLPRPDRSVIAAGPLTKQPGTMAYRVVLRMVRKLDNLVVHNEVFEDWPYLKTSHFSQGDYFQVTDIKLAVECFAKRVEQNASCIPSCMRDDTI